MANRFIYVWSDDGYDRSRWLSIAAAGPNELLLNLSDLCHPGTLSTLSRVSVERIYLVSALEHGGLQITTSEGYLLVKRSGSSLALEFRGREEDATIRVSVLAEDVEARLSSEATDPRVSAL